MLFPDLWGPQDRDIFESCATFAREHGMESFAKMFDRLLETIDSGSTMDTLRWFPEIRDRVFDELSSMVLLWLDPKKVDFYEGTFGPDVDRRFPSAAEDIREANKCFALERYTACVFFLIRILEGGLTALAARVGVRRKQHRNPNWHNVLQAVEKKIAFYEQQTKNKPTKRQLERLGDAAAHLRTFKNAWRNKTSHDLDAVYEQDQARDIMNAVGAFMRSIAPWLKER